MCDASVLCVLCLWKCFSGLVPGQKRKGVWKECDVHILQAQEYTRDENGSRISHGSDLDCVEDRESGLLRYWWSTMCGMRFGQRGMGSRNIHEYDKNICGPVMVEVIQLAYLMRYVKLSALLSCGQIAERAFFNTTIKRTFDTRIYSPHIIHCQKHSTTSPSPHFHSFPVQLQTQSPFSSSCPSDLRIARQTS